MADRMDGVVGGGEPAQNLTEMAPRADQSIFSCIQCRAIIADSTNLLDSNDKYGIIIVNSAKNIHIGNENPVMSREGFDAMTVYFEIRCSECRSTLGRQYFCTPAHMDCYRNMFTLLSSAVSIYTIGSCRGALPLNDKEADSGLPTLHDIRRQYERLSEIVMILLERFDTMDGATNH